MNDKIDKLIEYIDDIVDIGDKSKNTLYECINLIHQTVPVDNAGVFSRLARCVSVSDDLSYVILSIEQARNKIEVELRHNKDPKFTILVKSGRPSTQAIESEIRFTVPVVAELESKLLHYDSILSYLNHLEKCLDRNIWIMRDLASYIKK